MDMDLGLDDDNVLGSSSELTASRVTVHVRSRNTNASGEVLVGDVQDRGTAHLPRGVMGMRTDTIQPFYL